MAVYDTSAFWDFVDTESDPIKIGVVACFMRGKVLKHKDAKKAVSASIDAKVIAEALVKNQVRVEAARAARREKDRKRKAAWRMRAAQRHDAELKGR